MIGLNESTKPICQYFNHWRFTMFCQNCGNQIADNTNVCPFCGAPTGAAPVNNNQQPNYGYQQPQPQYQAQPQQPVVNATPQMEAQSKSVLTFGILAIAFGCSFFLSFLGIIFGAIAGRKANEFIGMCGVLYGRAKVGKILGKIGLILGIVLTVFFVIYLFAIIIVALRY